MRRYPSYQAHPIPPSARQDQAVYTPLGDRAQILMRLRASYQNLQILAAAIWMAFATSKAESCTEC